jgi:aminocarboxymuconate-semialdehyde decarboxylase
MKLFEEWRMTIIDIHSHIYPAVYLEILEGCGHIRQDLAGSKTILESGTESGHRIKLFEEMWNIDKRLAIMDSLGVQMQILSIGNPWVSYIPKAKCKAAARRINIALSEIVKKNPRRFVAMGVIPFSSMADAVEEIDFAVEELEMRGFMIGTHSFGKAISSDEFLPCFEEAQRKDVPVFIHPLARQDVGHLYDRLTTVGLLFPNETTITAMSFMTNGVLDKFPNLKIILAHLGGNIPISIGRIERAVKTNPTRAKLTSSTQDYLKRFYLDSIAYYRPALEYATDIWGSEKVMLGSDFPWHWSTESEKIVSPITESKYDSEIKERILGENAAKLFKI